MSEYIVELKVLDAKLAYPEIVRCRDCRYYDTHTEPPECYREVPGRIVAPDGYCKWGEHK